MYILEEFREVVQPDHPEEVNLGKCSDDVEFCVLWQLRLQFKREKSSVSDVRPLAVTKQEHACSEPDALETTQQHKQGQDLSTIPEPVPGHGPHDTELQRKVKRQGGELESGSGRE